LKAKALFKRDKDYLVRDGEVLIVDEFTGRVLIGRRYSEGLHQAIEAKEGVQIQRENHTLATITFQNYFRLYKKLAGMTGTALTEAEEFNKIYKLDVMVIPTNQPIRRDDQPDLIFRSEEGKFNAVVAEIQERHEAGQPVLVGTTSVEISERLAELLNQQGIGHNVLNAKQHAREATVIAQAGRSGSVTIATNMAGRGTDIVLGGNPAGFVEEILREREIDPAFATAEDRAEALEEAKRRCDEDREKVVSAGGLYIIGTERHESRRIDNQLRGRSGRQGDPGESRFFVSLEDDLMRRFGSDRVAGLMSRMGMDDDVPLESKMVSGVLEQAQTKVEAYNFDIRKHVVEYDDVIAAQRDVVYTDRCAVLERANMHERIIEMMEHEVKRLVTAHTAANLAEDWDLDALVKQFETWGIAIPDEIFPENLNSLRRETLTDELTQLAKDAYTRKEESVIEAATEHKAIEPGDFYMRQFERAVVLHVLDTIWREHIDNLDVMRSGIGLRGVAQRDPLVEFKREAYLAFDEFKREVERQIVEFALRAPVQIQVQEPPPQALPQHLQTNVEAIAKASGQAKTADTAPMPLATSGSASGDMNGKAGNRMNGARMNGARMNGARMNGARSSQGARSGQGNGRGPARSGQRSKPVSVGAAAMATASVPEAAGTRVGRNDPCYCGSGKKYKFCHGR
ncbi:MAG: SEC-C domain-containing protein, partial [Ktedonobacterales bacterium]|nr:SEC-C domain-containing protein [Ktedonobacterales bacterium]